MRGVAISIFSPQEGRRNWRLAAWACGLRFVHSSNLLCDAAFCARSLPPVEGGRVRRQQIEERSMQHFHAGNLHQIKDAPPGAWATVHASDAVTISELARRGFHLVDMSGEVWTMHRAG